MLRVASNVRGALLGYRVPCASLADAVRCFSSEDIIPYRTVHVTADNAAGTITISRPRALNAVNSLVCDCTADLWQSYVLPELIQSFHACNDDLQWSH